MTITLNGTTGITTPALDSSGPLTSLGIDDNATSTAITIDASNNVGIGTSSPSGYDSRANNLVVGDAGDAGITIFSGATSNARLQFAPSGSTGLDNGLIGYDNSNDLMVFATGGSDRMRIDSAGRVTMPYQPAFKISYSSASGGDTGSDQDLTFKVQEQNIGGHYNSTTGKFTAPVSGTYMFVFNLLLTGMGGGDSFEMFIKKNGNSAQNSIRNAYSSGSTGLGGYIAGLVVCQVPLSVNDFVTFQYYRGGSTATVYSSANWSNYSGHLIG